MLYNSPHAQLFLPAWPALAAESALPRAVGAESLQGWFILSAAAFLVVRTRQPFSLFHALSDPRRAAGSTEWPISWLPGRLANLPAAGTTADSHLLPRLLCLVAAAALRRGLVFRW